MLKIKSVLTTLSFTMAISSIIAIASPLNAQYIENPVYDEMLESPDIFEPELFSTPNDFAFSDEAKSIMKGSDQRKIPFTDDVQFPFYSEGLTPAKFQPYIINDPQVEMGDIPICIIGTDAISIKWLELRKNDLYENMVACIVVEAKSESNINYLQDIAPLVSFVALEASWLQLVHIKHYPAIIYRNQVFQ